MNDIELIQMLRKNVGVSKAACDAAYEAADRIDELSAALTQSRAETAAAYERAADLVDDMRRDPQYSGEGCDPIIEAIRALATPDQTTALDTLVAEVESRAVEKTAEMVRTWRNTTPMTGKECANAILALIGEKK